MPYHHDEQRLQGELDEKKGKPEKGTVDGHTPELQWGSSVSANKDENFADSLAHSLTIPQVQCNTAHGASLGETGCETRQAQDQDKVARVVPVVGNGPPSRFWTGQSTSTGSGVAVGELQVESPSGTGPANEQGISSAVRIRGSVIELSGQIKHQPVKVLIDSGATGNFITDGLVTAWELPTELEEDHQELKLADGSTAQAAGRVQFNLQCGAYKAKITARVFPNLHKEVILGMPWLIQENPAIDWARGQVQIQRQGNVLQLPVHRHQAKANEFEMINLCTAKQMVRWFHRNAETPAFLGIIRLAKSEDKEVVPVVPDTTGAS